VNGARAAREHCSASPSVRFLTRYLTTRTLTPLAAHCLIAGGVSTVWFAGH
jgi:hypothetical protein